MKRRTGAIIQTAQGFKGIGFSLKDREISDVEVYEAQSLGDLRESFKNGPYGITLDDSSGYLFNLSFPFSGRRKIGMVIKSEVDELLPFPGDDMIVSFKEIDHGSVLAAAIPKTAIMETLGDVKPRYLGLQSLSALYALQWAGRFLLKDIVFIHFNESTVVMVGIRNGKPELLRQFIHADEDGSFDQALSEILAQPEYHPGLCILVRDCEDRDVWKDRIERRHSIKVDMPSLSEAVENPALPKWLWSGFGAALMALSPKGEINLAPEKPTALPEVERIAFLVIGCLAGLSMLVWGLFFLNYRFKQAAYQYLDAQPTAIYKAVFPKSGQIKDVTRAFQEKIRGLERQSLGSNGLSALGLLSELSSRIDSQVDVKVNDFTLDEKEFTFSGTTVSFASLEKIKSAVEGLKGVTVVDLQNVELASNRQVRFKIRGKL